MNKQMLGLYHVSIPTFLFNSCFLFFGWKWILNIEVDHIWFANLLGELSSLILSLLNLYPLLFIEIELTRIRLSYIRVIIY